MTFLCRVVGHKWAAGVCSRCWPDGMPEEVMAALMDLEEAFEEAKKLMGASVK